MSTPMVGGARDRERGSSMVEFALVLPVLMMLLVGMFSGGMAYSRKSSLATSAREASRYAATLPLGGFPSVNAWLGAVASAAQKDAFGDLDSSSTGYKVCVAYLHPAGAAAPDVTASVTRTAAGDTFGTTPCFDDGRPDPDERRVEVQVERDTDLEAVVFTNRLHLVSRSLMHFEAQ